MRRDLLIRYALLAFATMWTTLAFFVVSDQAVPGRCVSPDAALFCGMLWDLGTLSTSLLLGLVSVLTVAFLARLRNDPRRSA